MKKHLKRVVVTGMGALTPLGEDIETYWSSLLEGKSGIAPMELADSSEYPCKISGEVSNFDPKNYMDLKESRRMARFSQLAVASAALAIKDANLDISKVNVGRAGVLLGNGNGGFPTTEENARILFNKGGMKVSPFFIPMVLPNMAAANVSRIFSIKGYTSTVITACAAGTQAIGEAAEVIRRGTADVIITGGCEAGISQLGLGGFNVIKALSRNNEKPEKASRPFDANRDGFVPAEGSATIILEDLEYAINRGANILAEVVGYGVSSDAYHLVQPDEEASGPARAMQWALKDASISNDEVDYINAHGTSTPKNDLVETKAIKKVFNKKAYDIPISSTKSMIGHALGGAGALEAVACIKTILSNTIHPTINYETPDDDCDLDYVPNKSRKKNVDIVLSNSFGFGGQNACLLFSRFNE
tara:strand:+ start:733 stop:1983 length:1251 start_codon:yes stop_codon:yes gene_type:complete